MWRKLEHARLWCDALGNTSTYVEKTSSFCLAQLPIRKHLHVCGENRNERGVLKAYLETPPRMWRKPDVIGWLRLKRRNTSTYVEKTSPDARLQRPE